MHTLELMMKRTDIRDFETVFALFTIIHCADITLDEIAECDLPESSLRDGYRAVRSSISSLMALIEQYRDSKIDTFLSACED